LVSRTLATFRRAEFGFFGVVVYTRVQTPRRCGQASRAGTLLFATTRLRGLRTSWLIVAMQSVSSGALAPESTLSIDIAKRDACGYRWTPREKQDRQRIRAKAIIRLGDQAICPDQDPDIGPDE
jgi:hypothetical protein